MKATGIFWRGGGKLMIYHSFEKPYKSIFKLQLFTSNQNHQVVTIDGTDDQCSFWIHHDIHVFPQGIHLHTHTHAYAHAPTHTWTPLYLDGFSNAIDLIDSKGLLFHDQRFPLVCDQHILHTVLRRRENHKTFILTMALNKDYRHPRKFCIFRAKFVSLGPSKQHDSPFTIE